MSVRRIVPNINAADPQASKPFYEKVLGLKTAMDMGWIVTFASPSNPTAQISVVASDTRDEPHADISVEVADVDACHAAAQSQGYAIVYPLTDEPWGVRRFLSGIPMASSSMWSVIKRERARSIRSAPGASASQSSILPFVPSQGWRGAAPDKGSRVLDR